MITEGNIREIYDITGLTPLAGGYEFTFPYTSAQDVRVYTTGNRTDTEVSTSNYTIDESGATPKVVFIAGYSFPAGQTKLTIIRNVSYSQKLDLRNGDLIDADKLEGALDNITQQIQQVAEKVDRAILSSVSDTEPLSIPEASQRNNMLLGFDSEGKAIPVLTTDIEQKLAQALAAEESAITAKNAAENAQHEAESAQSAAETAQGKAETAQAAAESAEASSQTLLASIETKTEESIASINTTKTGAVGAVTTQQATSVAAVQAAQNTAESDIAGKRSSALTAIDTAKTTAVAAVNTQKETSVAAADREIVAKRDSALTDIQTARTNAVNAITTKKDQSLQEVEQLASERKTEINSLAANQKADVKQYTDSVVASAKTEIDTEKTTAVTAVQEEGDAKVAIIGSSGDAEVTRVQSVYQTDLNELKGDLDYLNGQVGAVISTENIYDSGTWLPKKDGSGGVQISGLLLYVFKLNKETVYKLETVVSGSTNIATVSLATGLSMKDIVRVLAEGTGTDKNVNITFKPNDNELYLNVAVREGTIPTLYTIYEQSHLNNFVSHIMTGYYIEYKEKYNGLILEIPGVKTKANHIYSVSVKCDSELTTAPHFNVAFFHNGVKENETVIGVTNLHNWINIKIASSSDDDNAILRFYNDVEIINKPFTVRISDITMYNTEVSNAILETIMSSPIQDFRITEIEEYGKVYSANYEGTVEIRSPKEFLYQKVLEMTKPYLPSSAWAGGLAMYDRYAVVLYNSGYMAVFDYINKKLVAYGKTATYSSDNHYNCGIFSNQILDGDMFPLIYTSKCKQGYTDCYVERIIISGDSLTTELIQTITFTGDSVTNDVDWLIDKKYNHLIMIRDATNCIELTWFNIPDTNDGNVQLIDSDIIKTITVNDSFLDARQGSYIYDNMLYYAQGTEKAGLVVVDCDTQEIKARIDLSMITSGEIEGICIKDGAIYANAHDVNGLEIKLYKLMF